MTQERLRRKWRAGEGNKLQIKMKKLGALVQAKDGPGRFKLTYRPFPGRNEPCQRRVNRGTTPAGASRALPRVSCCGRKRANSRAGTWRSATNWRLTPASPPD